MLKTLQNTDFICHYTNICACKNILATKKIWLTPRKKTYDIVERMFSNRYSLIKSSTNRNNFEFMHSKIVEKTNNYCTNLYNSILQASFCQTNEITIPNRFITDDYCFMHTRMWEQYGENYSGFGLVLSKNELKNKNPNIIFSKVKYMTLDSLLSISQYKGIDIDKLYTIGQDFFYKEYKKMIIKLSLQKSKDYLEENEFRALTFGDSPETKHVDLNIEESLKAIVYFATCPLSAKDNEMRNQCLAIARKLDIEIICIIARDNGINIKTEKEIIQESANITNILKSI